MAYVRREYPQWSWSFSRQQTFETCRRMYYYQYYGSHNGWEFSAPPEAAQAYRLKKLLNLYTTLGDAVHQAAQLAVERLALGRALPKAEETEEYIRQKLRNVWRWSVTGRDQFIQKPNQIPMLHEFYYGSGPAQDVVDRINERITSCAQNLAQSTTLQAIAVGDGEVLACEQFDTFLLYDTPVYAVPDLVYRQSDGTLLIVDWKTGRQDEQNVDQVALYGLFTHEKYGVRIEDITVRLEYLETGSVLELSLTEEMLNTVRDRAETGMEEMRSYLDDIELNRAKPKAIESLTDKCCPNPC
jgi:RecB family exonuclease